MKAIFLQQYGSPDYVVLKDIDIPEPKANEVLVKVRAASVNEWDLGIIKGEPFVNRLGTGLFHPKKIVLGADVAGQIEAIGSEVTNFKPGDEVFGDLCQGESKKIPKYNGGAFAEYLCANENTLRLKSPKLSFEQAASIPQAGALAVQGLLGKQELQAQQKVLINGASGGVGTLALQIAKSFGTEVTAVCSGSKTDFVRGIGADHVIDYKTEDFTKNGRHYDFILDVMGHHAFFNYKKSLNPNGRYVMLGGSSLLAQQTLLLGPIVSWISNKSMRLLMYKPNKNIDVLVKLIEDHKVRPIIDKIFPLEDTAAAFQYYAQGQAKGKVVISLE